MSKVNFLKGDLMGSSEAAKMMGLSNSAFSNRAKNNNHFNSKAAKIKSTTLYNYEALVKWMQEHDMPIKEEPEFTFKRGVTKSIGIIGRPRTGKDHIISTFLEDPLLYRRIFSTPGHDSTKTRVVIKSNLTNIKTKITFYASAGDIKVSNIHLMNNKNYLFEKEAEYIIKEDVMQFFSMQEDLINKNKDHYLLLKRMKLEKEKSLSIAKGILSEIANNDELKILCKKKREEISSINKDLYKIKKEIGEVNKDLENLKEKNYIEITSPMSLFTQYLAKDNFDELILYSTPGVAGKYGVDNALESVDVLLFAVEDEPEEEFVNSLKEMAPILATNKVLFLYRSNIPFLKDGDYLKIQNSAKSVLENMNLNTLKKGPIINKDLSILNPLKNYLAVPPMNVENLDDKSYQAFKKEFFIKLKSTLAFDTEDFLEKLKKLIEKEPSFTLSIIDKVNTAFLDKFTTIQDNQELFNINKGSSHDRVKTNENHLTVTTLHYVRYTYLKNLYNLFISYNSDKIKNETQQKIVKLLYKGFSTFVKNDYLSLGYGFWSSEDHPCTTQAVLESLVANKLVNSKLLPKEKFKNIGYREKSKYLIEYKTILESNNITSRSWGSVRYKNPENILKLQVINDYLMSGKYFATSFSEAVELYYILGLQLYFEKTILGKVKLDNLLN